ncbi:MAG: four helix bundle protein [FCB group bacterium]|jgi:four helix bundle protein|nr:four helix bundle protein [FCB group bacterium]
MVENVVGKQKTEGERSSDGLKTRTRQFALRVITLYGALPESGAAQVIGKQLLRSGTSVGAHYREGIRSRSNAEYASKMEGALQELEESVYWMELLSEAQIVPAGRLVGLHAEADELIAILVTCVRNAKSHTKNRDR